MLNRNGTELLILESFSVDRTLPKYAKEETTRGNQKNAYFSGSVQGGIEFTEADSDFDSWSPQIRIKAYRGNWFTRWFQKRKARPTLSIEDFFKSVKNTTEEIKIIEERAAGYEKALQAAQRNGQHALVDKLKAGIQAYRAESQMLAIGIESYVTSKTIIEFYKKCPKGLRLDYIRNFTRTIPPELSDLKVRADELELFDNYAVLHYDPDAKSYAETEKEKADRIAKERDPILFGLIKGRDDLYVLGDWVDEFCDLTLDQMADILGAPATQAIQSVGQV